MSKSILVIDTPNDCRDCELRDRERGNFHCSVKFSNEPCPLVDFPQRKEIVPQTSRKKMKANLRAEGFNTCIDEILKRKRG